MENQFPKNVRQIGNVSDIPKVYVEDYVDTFLNQLCERTEDKPAGALLVGTREDMDGTDCVYVSGAVRIEEIGQEGADVFVSGEMWKQAEKDAGAFFPEKEVLGSFLTVPGQTMRLNNNLERIHEQHFTAAETLLVLRDAEEKDELFFAYKFKELMLLGGHYIYYERNPEMQNYMIANRKKNGVTPGEIVEDKAAKNFRHIVRERFEVQEQKKNARFMYAMSISLVLIVLIAGVTMINNYDKMQAVQSSLDSLQQTVAGEGGEEEETVATSGTVTADTGSAGEKTSPDDEALNADSQGTDSQSTDGETPDSESTEGSQDTSGEDAVSTMQEMSEDIYIVEKGDTLAKISQKVYGDTSHVDAICRMNGLSDGNLIFIGQKLLLP